MGQKANLETLRKFLKSINLTTISQKEFLIGFNFLKTFSLFFRKKGLILNHATLNFIGNKAILKLSIFCCTNIQKKFRLAVRKAKFKKFKAKKPSRKNKTLFLGKRLSWYKTLKKYKNEFRISHNKTLEHFLKKNNTKKDLIEPKLTQFKNMYSHLFIEKYLNTILKELKILGVNSIVLSYDILNKFLKTSVLSSKFLNRISNKRKKIYIVNVLCWKFKSFQNSIFPRRANLFGDFIKISYLFSNGLMNSKSFIFILSRIFKFLLKRQHSRFFQLLKRLFKIFRKKGLKFNKAKQWYFNINQINSNILGLKFLICGRLKGKLRKKKIYIQSGSVPIQEFQKNIEFEKTQVLTRYGVFGLKLWVNRKN